MIELDKNMLKEIANKYGVSSGEVVSNIQTILSLGLTTEEAIKNIEENFKIKNSKGF